MASIHRQPGKPNWFCAYYDQDGNRRFKSTKTTNRKQAESICSKWEKAARDAKRGRLTPERARQIIEEGVAEIADASGVPLPRRTIRQHFESWMKAKAASEGTLARYRGIVDGFLRHLGEKSKRPLAGLTDDDILSFRDELEPKVSAGTVNTYLKVIRVALNSAVKRNIIDRNPCIGVDNLDNSDRHRRRAFTLPELKKILGAANDDWQTMVLLGLYTGLRLGDCAALTWQNIDVQRAELTTDTEKTARTQIVPIAKPLFARLMRIAGDDPKARLCPSLQGLSKSQLSNQFYDVLVSAGLLTERDHQGKNKGRNSRRAQNEISFHSLRHTATSMLKNAGVSDAVARDIIGHESEAVSRNYTHIDTETKRAAVNSFPDITT